MSGKSDPSSGMIVYPKLPVPESRPSEPRVKGFRPGRKRFDPDKLKLLGATVVVVGLGGALGYFLAPSKTAELASTKKQLATAQTAAKVEKDRADGVEQQLAVITKDKVALETELTDVKSKYAETEKKVAEANAAAEKKLQALIDKKEGSVSSDGNEIRLKLVDKVLFAVGDDQLTDKGKAVLDKVAKALAELPDKQVWVQGHTDDQPIVVPKAKKKGEAPVVRFASNWELSAARALQVVHYLQDVGKIDPTRLAALAFSEYRPVSKANKALNRRIEIVLYPHKAVIERDPRPSRR